MKKMKRAAAAFLAAAMIITGSTAAFAAPAAPASQQVYIDNGKWATDPITGNMYFLAPYMLRGTWAYLPVQQVTPGQPDHAWYLFAQNGVMLTGWQTIAGAQFFFNDQKGGMYGACTMGPQI